MGRIIATSTTTRPRRPNRRTYRKSSARRSTTDRRSSSRVSCHCEKSEAISLKFSCHVLEKLIGFAVTMKLVGGDRLTHLFNDWVPCCASSEALCRNADAVEHWPWALHSFCWRHTAAGKSDRTADKEYSGPFRWRVVYCCDPRRERGS